MLTGVVDKDSLSSVLRTISQRRQQGVLEVTLNQQQLAIKFHQGRIVDVIGSAQDPVAEIVQYLQQGGHIPRSANVNAGSYSELLEQLQAGNKLALDDSLFREVVTHRILDRLYALRDADNAFYNMRVQAIDFDRELAPSISVGKLLLDLVALEEDSEKFARAFPAHGVIELAPGVDLTDLSTDEAAICRVCQNGPLSVAAVRAKSYLNRSAFQEVLLALAQQEVLTCGEASEPEAAVQSLDITNLDINGLDDIVAALEDSIDGVFAEEEATSAVAASLRTEADPFRDESGLAAAVLEEEDEDDDEAEAEDFDFQPGLNVRFNLWSAKLLQSSVVPHVLVMLFLAAALLAPLLLWSEVFTKFSRF